MTAGHDQTRPGATDVPGDVPAHLLVTGATGFLASHFVTAWLDRHPSAQVACLVRAADPAQAAERLDAALRRALVEQALEARPDSLLARATALPGGLDGTGWLDAVRTWRQAASAGAELHVLHSAANLSFRAADRDAVRAANIEGTRHMLAAAEALGAASFNYVSTAYVAGDRTGAILEDERSRPPGFTNAYEESKWDAEALVRESGLPFRILRPSIIIAHSVTHLMSSMSGFYKVAETMQQLGRVPHNRDETILLPVPEGATLDLIPVDVVVDEMIQILEKGGTTLGHAFHLTAEQPLPLMEVLETFTPLAGLKIGRLPPDAAEGDKLARALMSRLRHYMPYLGQVRRFDRRNMQQAGIVARTQLDVASLERFVSTFLGGKS